MRKKDCQASKIRVGCLRRPLFVRRLGLVFEKADNIWRRTLLAVEIDESTLWGKLKGRGKGLKKKIKNTMSRRSKGL